MTQEKFYKALDLDKQMRDLNNDIVRIDQFNLPTSFFFSEIGASYLNAAFDKEKLKDLLTERFESLLKEFDNL